MSAQTNQTDEFLVQDADSGLRGQGAVVEMMRRLKDTVVKLDQTSASQQNEMLRLTRWITILTWVMVIVGVIQLLSVFLR
jgi:CHASE3 domain sensor protein